MANEAGRNTQRTSDSRADLKELVDDYIAAIVAHDPAAVPIAPDAHFVENLEPKSPGEGLWQSATDGPTDFEIYVPDPVAGQVGYFGLLQEEGDPILLGLRLQAEDDQLAEMEHLIARDLTPGRDGIHNLDNLESPREIFSDHVPADERHTREELLDIAATYYDALEEDDGSLTPFDENCVRRENGRQTTCDMPLPDDPEPIDILFSMDAAEQIDTGMYGYIDSLDPVRVEIADVETGTVCGLSQFRHSMTETMLDIEGVGGIDTFERDFEPFDVAAMHVYKISDGKIRAIEANGFRAPYNSATGWE